MPNTGQAPSALQRISDKLTPNEQTSISKSKDFSPVRTYAMMSLLDYLSQMYYMQYGDNGTCITGRYQNSGTF